MPNPIRKKVLHRRDAEVGVWEGCCHYILVSTTKKRITNWRVTRVYWWGKIISTAAETINITDVLVLLAIVKFAMDHPERTKETVIIDKEKYVVQVQMDRNALYRAVGNRDWRQLFGDPGVGNSMPRMGSIMRLRTWVVQYWQNGDRFPSTQQYLYEYDCQSSVFSISRDFFIWCLEGVNIDFELLKEIGSQIAQALYLYLRGNSTNRHPKLCTLVTALGLGFNSRQERYEARRMIDAAFRRLAELRVVEPHYSGDYYLKDKEQFWWRKDINFYGGRLIC